MSAYTAADHQYMAQALRLAEHGLYTTRPNPRVGCVLVRDGRVVGEGWHRRAGGPHAEVYALQAAGAQACGATAYVTLEPCSHFGRTAPCADALLEAGVARVVAAMTDPNPRVAGQGLARLQAAGVEVAAGLLEREAAALNPGFVARMTRGRPYVRIKLALSLDGRTALASGESKWISSEAARRDVHRLRARSDAVLTGIGTALADDPELTVRLVELPADGPGQPLRVVLDRELRLPPTASLLRAEGRTLVLHEGADAARAEALCAAGAELAEAHGLAAALALLAAREANEVLVEAGPRLAGALLQAGLADELILYLAPHLMGHEGAPLMQLAGIATMTERLALEFVDVRRIGPDLKIVARPQAS